MNRRDELELFVLGYCNNVEVPGTDQLREYQSNKLDHKSPVKTKLNKRVICEGQIFKSFNYKLLIYHIVIEDPDQNKYNVYFAPYTNIWTGEETIYYCCHPIDEAIRNERIENFIAALIKGRKELMQFKDDQFLSDFRFELSRSNDIVHRFSDFDVWNKDPVAEKQLDEEIRVREESEQLLRNENVMLNNLLKWHKQENLELKDSLKKMIDNRKLIVDKLKECIPDIQNQLMSILKTLQTESDTE